MGSAIFWNDEELLLKALTGRDDAGMFFRRDFSVQKKRVSLHPLDEVSRVLRGKGQCCHLDSLV